MALNSFGQSSPLMAFSENRSPSNGSGPDSGRKSNGLKSMPPTPPQMYTTDAPMANEEFTGTTTVNSSPTKIPLSGRSNDTKMGMNGRSNNSNAMIRKKGLPWVLCSMVCVIFLLLIMIAYLMFKIYGNDQIEYWSTIPPSSTPSPISSASPISSSIQNKSPLSAMTTTVPKFTTMATTTISSQKVGQNEQNLAPIWPKLDQKHESVEARFSKAAIASENALCSEIGRNVLLKGGNAIDAAISISICIGALNSHSSGLGGGFLMTYYQRFYGKCYSIDARETAPSRTDKNTFNSNPTDAKFGYKSVAIPGEIHGFWTAFKRFGSGRIAWMDLLMPTVNLLNEGFPASKLLETNLKYFEEKILNGTFPGMRNQYLNPSTGNLYKEGEIVRKPILANTLHRLALSHDPVQLFYSPNGEIAKAIVEEFASNGLINRKDLHMYRSVVDENPLLNTEADSKLIFCGPKPSSGFAVTQLILAIMLKFYPMKSNSTIPWNSDEFWHRLIEAEKFAYSLHAKLGDINFVKNSEQFAMEMTKEQFVEKIRQKIGQKAFNQSEYLMGKNVEIEPINEAGGTSQLLVIDVDGNAVSMTNSINKPFGSLILSPRLGIVWNNHMADFNLPNLSNNTQGFAAQSSTNFIEPGKRPMSSMSPMIAYDRETKKVKLAIGASGGPKISSAIAQVLIQMLSFGHGPKEAIDTRRIHNQFTPISTEFEAEFPKAILDALQNRGQQMVPMHFPFSYVQAIVMADGESKDEKVPGEFMIASNDGRRQIHSQPIGY